MAVTGVGLGVSAAVRGFMAYRKKNPSIQKRITTKIWKRSK